MCYCAFSSCVVSMSRPLRLLVALCLLQAFAQGTGDGFYTIISPGTIHPNAPYNVIVSVQHAPAAAKIKLGITGHKFEVHQEVEVQPMSMKDVEFAIPDIESGTYSLTVEGVAGLNFHNSTRLNFAAGPKPNVYIQTDKATYKPGDLVQFRVIFLDENLRSAQIEKPVVIFIKDADKNRIKQFSNVVLNKGVFSGKLQLSEFPTLGEWQIEVQLDGAIIERKSLTVDKYVLPKFEVLIDAPKRVPIAEEKLGFTVRSKYTFDKWVKGKAVITIKSYKFSQKFRPMPRPLPNPPIPRPIPFDDGPRYGPPDAFWSPPQKEDFTVEKIIDTFNGKTYVEFELKSLVPDGLMHKTVHTLDVEVVMEEELTGNKQTGRTKIDVVHNRFQINAPKLRVDCKDPAHTFEYAITVTNLDDEPVSDAKQAVIFKYNTESSYQTKTRFFEAYLNASGMASVPLNCAEHGQMYFEIKYREQETVGEVQSTHEPQGPGLPGLHVTTERPTLNNPIEVQLNTEDPLSYFVYTIVARGNIIRSEFVTLPPTTADAAGRHTFHIKPSFEMIPLAKIYVHYIKDKDLKFYETSFDIEKQFKNSIAIEAPQQAKPGEDIELKVRTNPKSFVGLMGVDQSVLLLKSGNDFDGNRILQDIRGMETSTPTEYLDSRNEYPGGKSGVVTLTNANYPHEKRPRFIFHNRVFARTQGPAPSLNLYSAHAGVSRVGLPGPMDLPQLPTSPRTPPPAPPRIRKQFLENWFFDDLESTDQSTLAVKKQVPDTITSWIITGFSLNSDTGFALTQSPTKIQTFRPFFIATNLPYSIKRGESVAIPVIIFNYMDSDLVAEVTLDNQDGEFEFTDTAADQSKRLKRVTVPSNNGESVAFTIRAKELGEITLKITAISPLAGDAIHKKLKVEPEGVTIFKNRDFYLYAGPDGAEAGFEHEQSLDIPADVVPDSEHIEVAVMGDILGSTISNLDKLVRMPSGCGEQNMINFVPNILVLRYLESIHQLSPAIEDKAKRYLEVGYQRELTYKHDDGSYSAFGKSDNSGSTWLTAYVMRSFHQAAKYIDIDTKVLDAGLDFLASKQAANGSFPEYGKVLDFSHHNEVGLTAFVLLAFLENGEQLDKHKAVIDRGFQYLQEYVQDTNDLYALSIAAYALQLRRLPAARELLAKLDAQARVDGGHKWWTKAVADGHSGQAWRPKSHDVEVTAYLLLTLLELNEPVLPVTKWLISQRNSNGGFASTQETVVGLQALIKFAEKSGAGNNDLQITVSAPHKVGELRVNGANAMVVQSLQLQKQVRQIHFDVKGTGTAILQISYRYNELKGESKKNFKLTTDVKSEAKSAKLELEACAEFVPLEEDGIKQSNMVVMEVELPSGYVAVPEALDKIREVDSVKRVETKNADTNVIVYFDSLTESNVKCLPIVAERAHEVADQKPVPVVIYDYYDNQKRATEFYHIANDLCAICADDECKQNCKK